MISFAIRCSLILAVISTSATPAAGYNSEIHKDFYDLAFSDGLIDPVWLNPPSATALDDFRGFLFELAKADPDFHRRWPRPEDFTAYALKDFLALNPLRQVVGIDWVPPERAGNRRRVVREGSIDPDVDRRNQDRLHLLPNGTVALDSSGRAVPADPRTLWFGPLVGPASQLDAHGATVRHGRKGSWLLTTLGRPHQYARPKRPIGFAPEFSESYAELAMIARLWGGEGAEWLAFTFAGNSLHGIEDLGNQIHATQIGTHRFYLDAIWAYIRNWFNPLEELSRDEAARYVPPSSLMIKDVNDALEMLKTPESIDPKIRYALYLEPTGKPGLKALAEKIVGSHHRLLEAYMQEQYLESRDSMQARAPERAAPAVVELIATAKAGDSEFRATVEAALAEAGLGRTAPGSTAFALVLAEALLDRSALEAADVYECIRAIAIKPLRRGRIEYHDGQSPAEFIQPRFAGDNSDNRHTRRFWKLNAASFARVVSAIRLWFEVFDSETGGVTPGSPDAAERAQRVALRLVSSRLAVMQRAEERREAYLAKKRDA